MDRNILLIFSLTIEAIILYQYTGSLFAPKRSFRSLISVLFILFFILFVADLMSCHQTVHTNCHQIA